MRVKNKIEILSLLDTLDDGFDYIEYSDKSKGENMLYDCTNTLSTLLRLSDENIINNTIREILHECNLIMDLMYNNKPINEIIYLIKDYINKLRDIVINKIETKWEILFLPYKVSMWDSFHSIWDEANKDPNCNCNVVPIPYYELNNDGTIKNECYEGNQFDENVNIINYKEYNIEKVQPDIIYIHNPYDEYNRLTMIDPKYFSKNIIKYTTMLVYVPYFIAGSYKDKNRMRSMYLLPGCINADRIIAQSYIHKDLLVYNGYDEKKILPLGSPKIDFILKNNKKNYDLQQKFIDTKIFLISTGIDGLLTYDNWADEIISIILKFKNKDNISLIWRPHPLTEITISTMRSNLIDKFSFINKIINESENIIIDNTPEVNNAINISDALICDYSSIMFQYIATEKPVMSLIKQELNELDRIYCIDYLGVYSINNMDIDSFIDIVLNDKDFKRKERIERFKNSINNSDGTCGEKVHHNIKNELYTQVIELGKSKNSKTVLS